MSSKKEINYEEWHKIGNKLCTYLRICKCQRKLKSIVDILIKIYEKGKNNERSWTSEEYLILAFLDSINLITHGTNCEYPIMISTNSDFWEWLYSIKDNPNLCDN